MNSKKYSSYDAIDRELEILKAEKEIHYQKVLSTVDRTKETIIPSKAVSFVGEVLQKATTGPIGTILKIAVPYAVTWFINRKRGK